MKRMLGRSTFYFLPAIVCMLLVFFPKQCFADSREDDRAWTKRHLEVPPPPGWFSIPNKKGMFNECAAYSLQDETLVLLACPAFEQEKTFAEILAENKAEEGSVSLGKSVLQSSAGNLLLYVPLKKGNTGAMFVILPEDSSQAGLLHRARPMLEGFKEFAFPKELFAPDIALLNYAGTFSFQKTIPTPELDAITLVQENRTDKNGLTHSVQAVLLPHFPLWCSLEKRLCWLEMSFGTLQPEGKHWKSVDAFPGETTCYVAISRDAKALVVLRGTFKEPGKLEQCQKALDRFEW